MTAALNHAHDRYLYDWKSPNKYKILNQGDDPTCLLACGASIEGTTIADFRRLFESEHGPISTDGTKIGKFMNFMESLGYNSLIGPNLKNIGFKQIGENLKNGYHSIATYPESGGNHSVLIKRIRVTNKLKIKMTYINSQIGGTQTSTFPLNNLNVQQFWK